jgi:hypothetical protein
MMEEEDLLFRPIMHDPPMYRYESLIDGTLDLNDVMVCNEAIAVKQENERRYYAAKKAAAPTPPRRR